MTDKKKPTQKAKPPAKKAPTQKDELSMDDLGKVAGGAARVGKRANKRANKGTISAPEVKTKLP